MKLKWQWFLGGRVMFWVSIILFLFFIFAFIVTYIMDITTVTQMKVQKIDNSSIETISKEYVEKLRH